MCVKKRRERMGSDMEDEDFDVVDGVAEVGVTG